MGSDETYDESAHRDDEFHDDHIDDETDRAWEPAEDPVARGTAAGDGESVYAGGRAPDDEWLGEGLASLMLVAGVVLFLFPEPATSAMGLLLVVAGVVTWIVAAAR